MFSRWAIAISTLGSQNKKDPAFRKRKTGSFAIPLKGAGNRANPAAAFRQTPRATAGRASIEKLYGN